MAMLEKLTLTEVGQLSKICKARMQVDLREARFWAEVFRRLHLNAPNRWSAWWFKQHWDIHGSKAADLARILADPDK